MNAASQCIQTAGQSNPTGMLQKRLFFAFLAWRYHPAPGAASILPVLVSSPVFFCSHLQVWRCRGTFVGFRTKMKAHYLWLQTTGTRARRLDNWQGSFQANWAWMFSKKGALCTAWQSRYWAQYRHKEPTAPFKKLWNAGKMCPVLMLVTVTVRMTRNRCQRRRSHIYVAWLHFFTYMLHRCVHSHLYLCTEYMRWWEGRRANPHRRQRRHRYCQHKNL